MISMFKGKINIIEKNQAGLYFKKKKHYVLNISVCKHLVINFLENNLDIYSHINGVLNTSNSYEKQL